MDHGYEVDVIDLLWFGNHLPPEVSVQRRDLFACSEADFAGYDQVIFLAGLSNDPMAEYSPATNFVQNGALPGYLAFIAKKAGVKRLIYACSCSIYGYTVDKLYDEQAPVTCSYPYGISKLQGERAALQLHDAQFSVISLRQGTVCGHSPRMRFDLIVNTMFKHAVTERRITVNNPSIWRPVLDIRDTVTAFVRAVQANYSISGAFNVASGNFTVGQVADYVKDQVEALYRESRRARHPRCPGLQELQGHHREGENRTRFRAAVPIKDIIAELAAHLSSYGDLDQASYYNLEVLKALPTTAV